MKNSFNILNYGLNNAFFKKEGMLFVIAQLSNKKFTTNFYKTIFFNNSQNTRSKNSKEKIKNNQINIEEKQKLRNLHDKQNPKKSELKKCNNENLDYSNKKKEEKKKLNKLTSTEKFFDVFKDNFPLQLNKKKSIIIDNNLTCFVPFDQILNRVKAVSLAKSYLENIINSKADFSDLCEDNFSNFITSKLDNIKDFRIEDDDIIKFDLSYNKSFKKMKFLVNLFDIKNYMFIGYDPSKEVAKNMKNYQHLKDHIIGN